MKKDNDIIVVKITRDEKGLYHAVSADLEGVFISHRDLDRIVSDMPNVIRRWFKKNRNLDVEVFQGQPHQTDDAYAIAAMTVPAEIAAAALGR